jgi:hypothetical protein
LGLSDRAVCGKLGPLAGTRSGLEATVQVREAGNKTGVRREEMQIAMSNALALMRWRDSGFLRDFSGRDFAWLLIGVLLAVVAIWAISHRRRRWF